MAIRQPPTSVRDPNLRAFLQELRNAIGKTGDQVSQVAQRVRQITNTPPPPVDPPGPPEPPQPPVVPGDGLAPPAPISLTATSDAWAIRLTWEQPADMPADYDQTEIWCRKVTDPDVSDAPRYLAGSLRGNQFVFTGLDNDLLSNADTWRFWVRNRDTENLFSAYFPNNDTGIEGQALPSPEDYIGDLIGDITSGTLWNYLGEKTKLLQGPAGIPNSVQARLTSQYNDLVQRIDSIQVSGNGTMDPADIWFFDADAQGWTGSNATVTWAGGAITAEATADNGELRSPTFTTPISGAQYPAIRVRSQQLAGTEWVKGIKFKVSGGTWYDYTPPVPPLSGPTYAESGYSDTDWDLSGVANWTGNTIVQLAFVLEENGQELKFDWIAVGRIAPGASYAQVEAIRVRSDKKNRAFFQDTPPASPHTDGYELVDYDLWFDTNDGNKPYRWNWASTNTTVPAGNEVRGTHWFETTDTRLADSWAEIYDIRTANANPTGAAAQRINGIAANATSALATGAANTASIAAEQTARADGDAALSQQISQISASVTYASRVFIQNTAPTSNSNYTLKTNDLWYDTSVTGKVTLKYWDGDSWEVRRAEAKTFYKTTAPTVATDGALLEGDLWFDTDDNNKPYIRSGANWVSVLEGYINTLADAKITTFEQTKVGYATVTSGFTHLSVDYAAGNLFDNGGTIWTKTQVDAWNSANPSKSLTWNAKLPLATAVKQVRVSDGTSTGTIEEKFNAQKLTTDGLLLQYTVKLDNNGWVSGFGLASEPRSDGSPFSEFGVRADRFWIGTPASPGLPSIGVGLNLLKSEAGTNAVIYYVTGRLTSAAGTARLYAYFQPAAAHGMSVGDWFTLKNIRASATTNNDNYHTRYNESFRVAGIQNAVYVGNTGSVTQNLYVNSGEFAILFEVDFSSVGYKTSQTSGIFSDPPKLIQQKYIPFIVTTTSRVIDGQTVPAGVYITDAYIRNATITNAKIADAAITMAKISGSIYSDNFKSNGGNVTNPLLTPNAPGWCITPDGTAFFGTVVVRSPNNVIGGSITASGGYSNTPDSPVRRTAGSGEFLFWSPSQLAVTYGRGNISFTATLSCYVFAGTNATQPMTPAIRVYRNSSLVRQIPFTSKTLSGPLTMTVNYLDTSRSDAATIYEFRFVPSITTVAADAYVDLNSIDEFWVEYKR